MQDQQMDLTDCLAANDNHKAGNMWTNVAEVGRQVCRQVYCTHRCLKRVDGKQQ